LAIPYILIAIDQVPQYLVGLERPLSRKVIAACQREPLFIRSLATNYCYRADSVESRGVISWG
jgi:hypothetical protein